MQTTLFEQWESIGKTAYQAAKELETIGTRVFEKLAQEQVQVLNTYVDTGMKQFSLVSQNKDYKDLWAAQARLVSECNEKLMSSAKKAADILNDARGDLTSWFERGVSSAITTSRVAAETLGRKAARAA
ncbi:MAG: phasin family protein [Chromatiales bacterium]